MSDFPPEVLPEWSEEELALWKSALDDRPPSRSLARTLHAVGIGGAITTAAAVAEAGASGGLLGAAAKAGTGLTLFKWGVMVGLASAVAVGGGLMSRHSNAPKEAALMASMKPAARKLAPLVDEVRRARASAEPAPTPQPITRLSLAATRTRSSTASQPDIGQEIQSIDAARTALHQGKTKEALVALDRYRAEHGKGSSLAVEATVLRIEALLQQGDRARAKSLASAFLATYPKSPYASRIRALMQKSGHASPAASSD